MLEVAELAADLQGVVLVAEDLEAAPEVELGGGAVAGRHAELDLAHAFFVFGAGVLYILRLMSAPPHEAESGLDEGPRSTTRTAGITPAPAVDADRAMPPEAAP